MKRSEIIDVMLVRTAPAERAQLRRSLETKSTEELEQMHLDVVLDAADEELIRIQAERAANRVRYMLETQQAREPQRREELAHDRKTFEDAARTLRSFGLTDANFNVIRLQLGGGFSVYQIQQFLSENPSILSPATQLELATWEKERIERHNQFLKNADIVTLKKLARQEVEQRRQQAAQAQLDATQVAAKQRDELCGYKLLTPESRHRGQIIDSDYIKKVDGQGLRELIRSYGSFQLNNILRYGNAQGA